MRAKKARENVGEIDPGLCLSFNYLLSPTALRIGSINFCKNCRPVIGPSLFNVLKMIEKKLIASVCNGIRKEVR